MRKLLGALVGVRAFNGWIHGLAGFVLGMLPLPVALVFALAVRSPKPLGVFAFAVVWTVLIAALGLPDPIRSFHVRLGNRLLGTSLPRPAGGGWPNRFRTSAWTVLHALGGGLLASAAFILVLAAFTPMFVWASGGGKLAYFDMEITVGGGVEGVWTLPVAAFYLVLLAAAGTLVTFAQRRLAPVLLGPRNAEKVAVLEERTAVLTQRNRLAQELHDSIGHTLTTSTIQAAVAGRLMEQDPETARRALNSIEESSRTALEDLDHVLGILRDGRTATKAPERTLVDLPALFEHVRQTGTAVDAVVSRRLDKVPSTVSREAYRIVQEGLTNAVRHAGPVPVSVRVEDSGPWLHVELSNPIEQRALRPERDGGGHGLVGIVDRVRLLRGEVTFSPVEAEDGPHWRLAARLPLRAGA
ncbi:sensor histidine kinase [Phytomonospora endophytica]|uniref:histidine kinase n=1 Tax=Phytomonospora endophytica TaxID=714109 RepID=A0A841FSP4_9ACTN|nr:histidine kinase [Phytomonospora endophytica]MBB6039295.1 signal transduction histidine kinase [Phytomonospora endophytica]GIG69763.1 two-component sensor histidine kinase [Phytomonospora endophytica]